ncbi:MAG: glutamine--fructose-6-phosphate transaminase (isomerizing) [Candidatus Caccovivens sp.]
MCGICACIGKENEIFEVVEGLKKLEYRGYDSSGVAFFEKGKIETIKSVGQIKNLLPKIEGKSANIAIGHTRWATHGVVSVQNAHPHLSQDENIVLVHNGIIENYEELKKLCINTQFYSQTDTEVLANLISKQNGNCIEKLICACNKCVGSFALAVLFKNQNKIFVAKRNSPLYVTLGNGRACVASDVSVFAGKFETFYSLDEDEFAILDSNEIVFFNKNGQKINKESIFLEKLDFVEENLQESTFMLKEIKEQAIVLRRTYFNYYSQNFPFDLEEVKKFKNIHFVACGTAYHSALLGAQYLQEYCKKDCKVSVASEFRYSKQKFSKRCLYVFVSQSGETADTIACAKLVKEKGCKVLCVTNVKHSSLNKLADYILPTYAGKEVAVASTKAYTAQVFTLLIFALQLANFSDEKLKNFVRNFEIKSLDEGLAKEILKYEKIFFVGRQQDYVSSLEGALKLKEIAYLNCLGIPAGELKHGTLALVDDKTLVIVISTAFDVKDKLLSNVEEIKARGGKVLLLSNFKPLIQVDYFVELPTFDESLMPIVSIIPLQLLALQVCVRLGHNPDKPRNLAKSVTVE